MCQAQRVVPNYKWDGVETYRFRTGNERSTSKNRGGTGVEKGVFQSGAIEDPGTENLS